MKTSVRELKVREPDFQTVLSDTSVGEVRYVSITRVCGNLEILNTLRKKESVVEYYFNYVKMCYVTFVYAMEYYFGCVKVCYICFTLPA